MMDKMGEDKKYVLVKIYARKQADNELNLVFEKPIAIYESDCIDLFCPSIFAENVKLKITISDLPD